MKKFVIYTAIVGAYDDVIQPLVVDNDFDYVLFSDCIKEKKVGVWNVRPIDYTNPTQTKIARYVKTHPHTLLPEYECSVWIDASVIIKSDYLYNRVKSLYADKVAISSLKHPDRDCIYDEAVAVVMYNFESEEMVLKWVNYLHKNHYPEHNGLCETRVLYRSQSEALSRFNEQWWKYIEDYSRRDQLSFNFVLWAQQLKCMNFFGDDIYVRDSEHMSIKQHTRAQNRNVYQEKNKPALLRISDSFPLYIEPIEDELWNVYSRVFHSNFPRIVIVRSFICMYVYFWKENLKRRLKKKFKHIILNSYSQ